MCGIIGAFSWRANAAPPVREHVERARDLMWRRGQDGSGYWESDDRRAVFGHRRLAIIDLDDRSRQPLSRGPLTLVFNGEIYNYRILRMMLERGGARFETEGDSEVILALFERDGPAAFAQLRGMFAIALFDARDSTLTLARDPYGIKPLYVGKANGQCWFASQVKALRTVPVISSEPDPAGLTGFHLWGSVPEPFTLYRSIRALPGGHWQCIDAHGAHEPVNYASIPSLLANTAPGDPAETEHIITTAVRDSVAAHLVADVEVGLFLSAGIDSAALLGTMATLGQSRIKAITIGFTEYAGTELDEVPLAVRSAALYGAEHIVERLDRSDIEASLEAILETMDQPSIDGVNSWFASRAAHRAGLRVAMSGLGADELLAGYSTFDTVPALHRRVRRAAQLPFAAAIAEWGLRHGLRGFDSNHPKAAGVLRHGGTLPGAYLVSRALLIPSKLDAKLDREIIREGLARLQPVGRVATTMTPCPASGTAQMMALEAGNYLRNQLLRDADWSSMAHTLELRTPFVDWPTLEAIAPVASLLGQRRGKRALAGAPVPPLPDEIVKRRKSGFATPLNIRIRDNGTLDGSGSRDWADRVARAFAAA